jgi:hypothetical protein
MGSLFALVLIAFAVPDVSPHFPGPLYEPLKLLFDDDPIALANKRAAVNWHSSRAIKPGPCDIKTDIKTTTGAYVFIPS